MKHLEHYKFLCIKHVSIHELHVQFLLSKVIINTDAHVKRNLKLRFSDYMNFVAKEAVVFNIFAFDHTERLGILY